MKKNSLNIEIWKYLILFSIFILAFLWVFQVLFLNKYYRWEKIKDIKEVAKKIEKSKSIDNLKYVINNAAYNKNICVEITDNSRSLYSSKFMSTGCLTGEEEKTNYKSKFINSNNRSTTYEIINPRYKNKTLVYALKLDTTNNDLYAFVNTSIEPIDSTVMILKNQLIYVSIIVLILSFLVAYFISRYISNPIVKMNKAAKKLANKEYNTEFSGSNIAEIDELATTLNYAKDELKKTDELRRDLMANVSHDLKTPLTMIKAYAEMSRDLNGHDKTKRDQNMNVIIEEVDRLTILVNDILTLSKVQSNIEELTYTEFDLVEMINSIIKRYDILKEKENYKFIFKNKSPIIVKADKVKIEQVIYNLINNAINYTGDDKKITIKIKNDKNIVRVEIIDTGKGIDEKDIPYIWDKYYKNKKKHKRNLIGTGLGLSIVKNILELHNYNYGVKSTKNKGTTFYFEIKKV